MKYEQLATDILTNIGGKENIQSITHCVTRIRFVLKDEAKANDAVIKQLNGVLDVVKQGGQYQVVIGPAVASVFDAVVAVGKLPDDLIAGQNTPAPANQDGKKDGWLSAALM